MGEEDFHRVQFRIKCVAEDGANYWK
jgi:hypothetical protein